MSTLDPSLEDHLRRLEQRWQWFRLMQKLFVFGAICVAILLVIGVCIQYRWIQTNFVATALLVAFLLPASLAFFLIAILTLLERQERSWLATKLEAVHKPLLDRLNTLVFLEKSKARVSIEDYARRIEKQARGALREQPAPFPFSWRQLTMHTMIFLWLLAGTVCFYQYYQPWKLLQNSVGLPHPPTDLSGKEMALQPPDADRAEMENLWGEVRITEPGRDLIVTKVDAVPLRVEAAANRSLKGAAWFTAANGGVQEKHPLPAPSEPNYAVYDETVYLDQMHLSDWDVLSYYATASTANNDAFASDIYFLEVRPFREDLLKTLGGGGGKCLNELTGLINRQKQIFRQTHQYMQRPPRDPVLKKQDQGKLIDAESDLGDAVQHFYAKVAAEMENKPVGQMLDHVAKAESFARRAVDELQYDSAGSIPQAQNALTELIAARKAIQKAISDNPDAFGGGEGSDEERPPVVSPSDRLKQISEFRNEQKAAQELVQKTLDQQRGIADRTQRGSKSNYNELAGEQKKMMQALQQFQSEHPQPFKDVAGETKSAQSALQKANQALAGKSSDDQKEQGQATDRIQELLQAMNQQAASKQLAQAYKLKQMLDENVQQLAEIESKPGSFSKEQLRNAAESGKKTTRELKNEVDQQPARGGLGNPLRQAMSEDRQREREAKLNALAQADGQQAAQNAAGTAKQALQNLSQAFSQSVPSLTQQIRKGDSLRPGSQESLDQALQQLQTMISQQEAQRAMSPQEQSRQIKEMMLNLTTGVKGLYGGNQAADQLLIHAQEMMREKDSPVDLDLLKELLVAVQSFQAEMNDENSKGKEHAEMTHIDPSRVPASYRDRVQKYFQKLSEQ